MPTDTKLKELIINELTEEQYKALTPNDDELYLTPDGSITKNENGSYVLDGNVEVGGNVFTLNGKKWGIMPVIKINTNGNYIEEGFILSDVLPSVEEGLINVSGIWFSADRNDVIGLCPAKTNFPKKSKCKSKNIATRGNFEEREFFCLYKLIF